MIASNAAGIDFTQGLTERIIGLVFAAAFVIVYLHWYSKKVKANPKFSYSYDDWEEFNSMWEIAPTGEDGKSKFTIRKKLILILFVVTFPLMVWASCLKAGGSQQWLHPSYHLPLLSCS